MIPNESLWRYAGMLSLAALLCGVLLGGLSAWFLGSVAIAGLTTAALTFNFHIPGALVRLFAIGRTVAKYGERLVGHKAALSDQVDRRASLFRAMAAAQPVRSAGWQLGDHARLTDYLDDVESLDYGRLRVGLPVLTIACGLVGGLAGTLLVAPLGVLPILSLLLVLLWAGRSLDTVGAKALEQARALQQDGARQIGMAMAAVSALKAERAWNAVCEAAIAPMSQAEHTVMRVRRRQSLFDALSALLCPLAAVSTIAAAYAHGARGEAFLLPIFSAFAWLALGETLQGASRIIIAAVQRRAAARAIAGWTALPVEPATFTAPKAPGRIDIDRLQRRAPDGRPLGRPVTFTIEVGQPTMLTGPSGSGKTSLLKQIAGWIGDDLFKGDNGALSSADRRALTMLCPHDAAVLADTVRANLFAPASTDEEMYAALEAVEMTERIAGAGGLDGWISQEVLSLGEAQRLNLARAFLSPKPLIVLDEPTEHLDTEQGARIVARLVARTSDRIVILSSHRVEGLSSSKAVALSG